MTVSVFIAGAIAPGISYGNNAAILAEGGFILFLVHLIVRPVVSLITLPINILTLGLFSFLINGFMLYLVALIIPGFKVVGFSFRGIELDSIVIPGFHVSLLLSYIIMAVLISTIRGFLVWLCSK